MKQLTSNQKKIIRPIFLVIICVLCFAIINIYLSNQGSSVDNADNNSENQAADAVPDYKVFKSRKGLYGVSDMNDNEIISPRWSFIDAISENCFIVACGINGVQTYGMLDNEENVIAGLAYSSLEYIGKSLIIGRTADNGKYMILKPDGSAYIDDAWDSYSISGNDITLMKNRNRYFAHIGDDRPEFYSFEIKKSTDSVSFDYNFDFSGYDGAVSHKIIEQMTEKSAQYLRAVENNDKSYIMSITAPDYYTSVIPAEYMGRKISDISEASVSIRNSDGNTIYEIDFRLKFSDDAAVSSESYDTGQIQDNDIDFIIIMDKDNSGSMIITAVYYTDMQKGLNDE